MEEAHVVTQECGAVIEQVRVYADIDDAYKYVSEQIGRKVTNYDELKAYNDSITDDDDANFYNVWTESVR